MPRSLGFVTPPRGLTILIFMLITMCLIPTGPAYSLETAPQTLPSEIIEAPALDVFSKRTLLWPYKKVRSDTTLPGGSSVLENLTIDSSVQASDQSPTISIRGSGSNPRVLGLFDGVPLNLGDGMGLNSLLVPTEVLGESSLIKGPGSVFYGSDAMSGAILWAPRIISQPTGRLGVRSFGGREVFAAAPVGASGPGSGHQLSYLHDDQDGNFDYRTRSGATGTRVRNNRSTDRVVWLGHQEWGALEISDRVILARDLGSLPGSLSYPNATTFQRAAGLASISFSQSASEYQEWALRLTHSRYENNYRDESSLSDSQFSANRSMGSFSYLTPVFSTVTGEFFLDQTYDEAKNTYDPQTRIHNRTELGSLFQIPMDKVWTLQPGLRFIPGYNKLVKSLGAVETLDNQSVWFTYSEGFRAPSVAQLYGETTYSVSNSSLRPETSKQWEIGFAAKKDVWNWGLTAFTISYEDLLQTESVNSTQTRWINEESADSKGLEANIGLRSGPWSGELQYTRLDTKVTKTGRPLRVSPENQASAIVSHQIGPAVIEIRDTYWGSYFNQSGANWVQLGPWNTVDLSVRTVGLAHWVFQTGVLNVFDVAREISIDYPEPQRRWYLSLEHSL